MPVRKYRSVEEMPGARRMRSLEVEGLRVACELSELAYGFHPWHRLTRYRRSGCL